MESRDVFRYDQLWHDIWKRLNVADRLTMFKNALHECAIDDSIDGNATVAGLQREGGCRLKAFTDLTGR